jgi:5-methyltetrahydrofolate--homocysteine methyltransferase
MVGALLTAEGFEVHDLGIDISAGRFLEAIKEYNPQIVAISALLTTTAPVAKEVIDELAAAELRDRVKVMVGGGAITAEFADYIGADGYDPTAPGAVEVARDLIATMAASGR